MPVIPLLDLAEQNREVADDIRTGFDAVLADCAFIGGKAVDSFEEDYARYVGAAHCVGVANGTDAIEIALRAAGIGAGDEVIVPANTFVATAEAVVRAGAEPVFVDCDDDFLLIDPARIAEAVGPRTRAVIPVDLYGQVAPMDQVSAVAAEYDLVVIEDAAQSQGARQLGQRAGTFGLAATTSFYPGKNLGAFGDAGALLTSSAEIARAARLIGAHGSVVRYVHECFGVNSRLDALQAVVLSAKLARLDGWNAARREAAARYDDVLSQIEGVRLPRTLPGNEHVWHLYVVRVPHRDGVLARLNAAGVGAAIHYPVPVHRQPAFASARRGDCPVAELSSQQILSLPIYPHLTASQQDRVAAELAAALR